MAKGNKFKKAKRGKGRPIKKGANLGVNGVAGNLNADANRQPPVVYEASKIDEPFVRNELSACYTRTPDELQVIIDDPRNPAGLKAAASVMLTASFGNLKALAFVLDRMIGPVVRRIEVKKDDDPYAGWTYEQLQAEKDRIDRENLKTIQLQEKEKRLIKLVNSGEYRKFVPIVREVGGSDSGTNSAE